MLDEGLEAVSLLGEDELMHAEPPYRVVPVDTTEGIGLGFRVKAIF